MDQSIAELNQKLDLLAAQIAYLTEQAQAAERAREERSELMHSMMPIANDAMRIATEQFQEVEQYVDPRDLLRITKKIVRSMPYIEVMLDQLDGIKDLLEIVMRRYQVRSTLMTSNRPLEDWGKLIDTLTKQGRLRSPAVIRALRALPRTKFLSSESRPFAASDMPRTKVAARAPQRRRSSSKS